MQLLLWSRVAKDLAGRNTCRKGAPEAGGVRMGGLVRSPAWMPRSYVRAMWTVQVVASTAWWMQ